MNRFAKTAACAAMVASAAGCSPAPDNQAAVDTNVQPVANEVLPGNDMVRTGDAPVPPVAEVDAGDPQPTATPPSPPRPGDRAMTPTRPDRAAPTKAPAPPAPAPDPHAGHDMGNMSNMSH